MAINGPPMDAFTAEKLKQAMKEIELLKANPAIHTPYLQYPSDMGGLGYAPPFRNDINTMTTNQATNAEANPPSAAYGSDRLASMVRMRLRSSFSSYFEHWHFHKYTKDGDESVLCLIVNDGKVTMLEDAWPLFPSDELITKLRLLER